jgi:hypothetical protein
MTRYKRYLMLAPLPFLLVAITPPRATASTHPARPSGLVTVWTEWTAGGQGSGFKALIAAWNAKHTGITILARPSLSTIAIFYFMWIWNDFILSLVYMQSNDKYTVPLGIMFLNGQYNVEWGLQMAGLAVATIIPLIVYYVFQKQFIRGITAGALKG